jgi:hypothetical protein
VRGHFLVLHQSIDIAAKILKHRFDPVRPFFWFFFELHPPALQFLIRLAAVAGVDKARRVLSDMARKPFGRTGTALLSDSSCSWSTQAEIPGG